MNETGIIRMMTTGLRRDSKMTAHMVYIIATTSSMSHTCSCFSSCQNPDDGESTRKPMGRISSLNCLTVRSISRLPSSYDPMKSYPTNI